MEAAQSAIAINQVCPPVLKTEICETLDQKIEGFRLRYQVYSLERGFEPGLNGDDHDCHSRHVLLRTYRLPP